MGAVSSRAFPACRLRRTDQFRRRRPRERGRIGRIRRRLEGPRPRQLSARPRGDHRRSLHDSESRRTWRFRHRLSSARRRDRARRRLKVLRDGITDVARFEREAELLATVRHPNVVSYVAHGLTEDGAPYLSMDWLDGVDLADRLGREPLAVKEALTVAMRTAQGLAAAHALGLSTGTSSRAICTSSTQTPTMCASSTSVSRELLRPCRR